MSKTRNILSSWKRLDLSYYSFYSLLPRKRHKEVFLLKTTVKRIFAINTMSAAVWLKTTKSRPLKTPPGTPTARRSQRNFGVYTNYHADHYTGSNKNELIIRNQEKTKNVFLKEFETIRSRTVEKHDRNYLYVLFRYKKSEIQQEKKKTGSAGPIGLQPTSPMSGSSALPVKLACR